MMKNSVDYLKNKFKKKILVLVCIPFLILSNILGMVAHALILPTPQIVLLTSLEDPVGVPINDKIEQDFRHHFEKDEYLDQYELVVVRNADPFHLWSALNNPRVRGLFWVSHAGQALQVGPGMSMPDLILDRYGHNVAKIFLSINPHLQYLGLVGCETWPIIQHLEKYGRTKELPRLHVFGKKYKVDARWAMSQAMSDSNHYLQTPLPNIDEEKLMRENNDQDQDQDQVIVRIERTLDGPADIRLLETVQVEIEERVYGVFPRYIIPGESQSIQFSLPLRLFEEAEKNKRKVKIKLETGLGLMSRTESKAPILGVFSIKSEGIKGSWDLFSKPNGTPIGVTQYLYTLNPTRN